MTNSENKKSVYHQQRSGNDLDAFKAIIKSYVADAKLKRHWAQMYNDQDQYALLGNHLAKQYDPELYEKMQKVSQAQKEMDDFLLARVEK